MIGLSRQSKCVAGSQAMSYQLAPSGPFVFQEVRLHLNASSTTAENFVVQLVSARGALFNVKLYSKDMNGVQDVIYIPVRPHTFNEGGKINFTWTNTNLKIWGLEIIYDG